MSSMSGSLNLTVVYEDGGKGWVLARVLEVPGAISQGRSREEARDMVLDALQLTLAPEASEISEIPEDRRESLALVEAR